MRFRLPTSCFDNMLKLIGQSLTAKAWAVRKLNKLCTYIVKPFSFIYGWQQSCLIPRMYKSSFIKLNVHIELKDREHYISSSCLVGSNTTGFCYKNNYYIIVYIYIHTSLASVVLLSYLPSPLSSDLSSELAFFTHFHSSSLFSSLSLSLSLLPLAFSTRWWRVNNPIVSVCSLPSPWVPLFAIIGWFTFWTLSHHFPPVTKITKLSSRGLLHIRHRR